MAGANISNSGLLFTRYLDGVVESLNLASKARNMFKQVDNWTGSHIEFTIHTALSNAIRYTEDAGAFPAADKQDYVRAKAYRKFVHASVQISDGLLAAAGKSKNVAKDAISSEMDGMMQGILKRENGFLFRDGTGIVANFQTDVTAALAGDTCTVDDGRLLWPGAEYDVYNNSALGTLRGSFVVRSVASALDANGEVVVTVESALPAGMVANTDVAVWKGAANRAITGLDSLIDDAAAVFQNVNCALYPKYTSFVLDNGTTLRDLTPNLFRQMLAGIYVKSGNERPAQGLKVFCTPWQAINVEELYEGELRLTPDSKVAGMAIASFQTSLGKVDIITDADALYNKMFFVDTADIVRAVQKPLSWRKQEGGGIFTPSQTAGVWTATAIEIADLYIKRRCTSGKIEDLNEDIRCAF